MGVPVTDSDPKKPIEDDYSVPNKEKPHDYDYMDYRSQRNSGRRPHSFETGEYQSYFCQVGCSNFNSELSMHSVGNNSQPQKQNVHVVYAYRLHSSFPVITQRWQC